MHFAMSSLEYLFQNKGLMVVQNESNKIWTPANIVTLIRIGALPLWFICAQLASGVPVEHFSIPRAWSAVFFILLSATDKLDGYLARSRGEVTVFGMFLDPIADKLLVLSGLLYLLDCGWIGSWVVLTILAREFIVSGLRMVASQRGVVIAAGNMGKWKTAITLISICIFLVAYCFSSDLTIYNINVMGALGILGSVLMYIALVLTVVSGVEYVKNSFHLLSE